MTLIISDDNLITFDYVSKFMIHGPIELPEDICAAQLPFCASPKILIVHAIGFEQYPLWIP